MEPRCLSWQRGFLCVEKPSFHVEKPISCVEKPAFHVEKPSGYVEKPSSCRNT
jgi:hypothetical protein